MQWGEHRTCPSQTNFIFGSKFMSCFLRVIPWPLLAGFPSGPAHTGPSRPSQKSGKPMRCQSQPLILGSEEGHSVASSRHVADSWPVVTVRLWKWLSLKMQMSLEPAHDLKREKAHVWTLAKWWTQTRSEWAVLASSYHLGILTWWCLMFWIFQKPETRIPQVMWKFKKTPKSFI